MKHWSQRSFWTIVGLTFVAAVGITGWLFVANTDEANKSTGILVLTGTVILIGLTTLLVTKREGEGNKDVAAPSDSLNLVSQRADNQSRNMNAGRDIHIAETGEGDGIA